MNNQTHPSVTSSALLTRLRLLPLLAFVLLALMLVSAADARTRDTRTSGGIDPSDMHEHGIRVLCTWDELQGVWSSDPGDGSTTNPTYVSHTVGVDEYDNIIPGVYATCSGWNIDDDGNFVEHIPNPNGPTDHENAPLGYGKFVYKIKYSSVDAEKCIEDPNSGIGNNCEKSDADNKNHNKISDSSPANNASVSCKDVPEEDEGGGTTLTYQFFCAPGVSVEGYLTAVPGQFDDQNDPTNTPDPASISGYPVFTNCGIERINESKCTVQYGGIPTELIKVKGQYQTVVDSETCLEAFPQDVINNALGSGQTQAVEAYALLYYQERAYTGECVSDTSAPTDQGSPIAAYGRYCSSDISIFDDNIDNDPFGFNSFDGDGGLNPATPDGFDNELRVCERDSSKALPHVASHDVDVVELAEIIVDFQPNLNLNCWSGDGGNDSGIYKVWIPDQGQLLASNVVADPLDKAPKLEGLSPTKVGLVTLYDIYGEGTENLELTYPTCVSDDPLTTDVVEMGLAQIVFDNSLTNNQDVTLNLTGDVLTTVTITIDDEDVTTPGISQKIDADIVVKVNGI